MIDTLFVTEFFNLVVCFAWNYKGTHRIRLSGYPMSHLYSRATVWEAH